MGTKKWADINKLSKARETDHAEVRAELAAELGGAVLRRPELSSGYSITPRR